MKRLVLILAVAFALFFFGTSARAQTSTQSRYNLALDTVTNTGTKNMTTLAVRGPYQTVTISTVNTLLTGTLAGVARLYGSLDGVNYSRIRSSQLQGNQVDSTGIDANRKSYHWVVLNSPYQYYQIQTTGSGTVTFTVQGKYVAH